MNTISAIALAQTPAPNTGSTAVAAASGGAAGLFQALLGGLLVPAQPAIAGGAQALPAEPVSTGDSELSGAGASLDTGASPPMMPAVLAAMQSALPVVIVSEDTAAASPVTTAAVPPVTTSAVPAVTIAAPVKAMAMEGGVEAVAVETALPMPIAPMPEGDDAFVEKVVVTKGVIAPVPGASSAPAAPSLESVIHAAAATISRSTERAFAGRRLDGPTVTGESGTSALQAIDSNVAGAEETGFARVAVNAATGVENQQSTGESGGSELTDGDATTIGDAAAKPTDAFKGLFEAEARPEIGSSSGVAPAKSGATVAAARASVPELVTVRDVGDVVVRSVHYLSGKTDEVVTLRLVPRSLGELQIAVRHAADGIEVVMTAANAAAREALEGHVAGLRDALARDGMDAPRVTIQVAAHFDAAYQPPLGGQGQHDAPNPAPRHGQNAYREPANPGRQEPQQQQGRRQQHDGRLNMWV